MFTFILGQYWFACYHSYSIVVMLFACCGSFLISPSFVKWLLPGEDFPQEPTSRSRAPAPFCLTTAVWICSSYRPVTTPILIPLLCPPLSWPASPTQQCAFRGSGDLAHLHIPGGNVDWTLQPLLLTPPLFHAFMKPFPLNSILLIYSCMFLFLHLRLIQLSYFH